MHANSTLIIASGNRLRGDDALGPAAADIIESWQIPGVKVRAVHQLVPELIEEMGQVERILFIDAATNIAAGPFQTAIVAPKRTRRSFGHYETPANLLALLKELTGREPHTQLVSISARSFEHGEEISKSAQEHLHAALAWIRDYLAAAP